MKWLVLGFGMLCLCACSNDGGAQAGSQTHFLSQCDDSCARPYSCICGVCTKPCSSAAACSDASSGAMCLAPVPGSAAGSCSASSNVCDLGCQVNADCSALGASGDGAGSFACDQGRCREVSGSASSGGAPAGGTSAASGSGGSAAGGRSGAGGNVSGGSGGTTQSNAGVGAQDAGAISGGQCTAASDCVLVPTGCCGACEPTESDLEAVLASDRNAANLRNCPGGPPDCAPCPPAVYDPERPVVRAACMAGRCTVVDLREQPESACMGDGECHLADVGCCGSCGPDPSGWIALSSVASDPYAPVCDPIPPCLPCNSMNAQPSVFCATDGHCAVRGVETLNGVPSSTCYSPTQNMDKAHDVGVTGCDCTGTVSGTTLCVEDAPGHKARIACATHWSLVNDGEPCP